ALRSPQRVEERGLRLFAASADAHRVLRRVAVARIFRRVRERHRRLTARHTERRAVTADDRHRRDRRPARPRDRGPRARPTAPATGGRAAPRSRPTPLGGARPPPPTARTPPPTTAGTRTLTRRGYTVRRRSRFTLSCPHVRGTQRRLRLHRDRRRARARRGGR